MAINGTKQIAQRFEAAHSHFVGVLMDNYSLTKVEAEKAKATLLKAKAIKADPVMGRMIVKHGAFMDAAVIRRAVEMA